VELGALVPCAPAVPEPDVCASCVFVFAADDADDDDAAAARPAPAASLDSCSDACTGAPSAAYADGPAEGAVAPPTSIVELTISSITLTLSVRMSPLSTLPVSEIALGARLCRWK
jgi:hypothetical protein